MSVSCMEKCLQLTYREGSYIALHVNIYIYIYILCMYGLHIGCILGTLPAALFPCTSWSCSGVENTWTRRDRGQSSITRKPRSCSVYVWRQMPYRSSWHRRAHRISLLIMNPPGHPTQCSLVRLPLNTKAKGFRGGGV